MASRTEQEIWKYARKTKSLAKNNNNNNKNKNKNNNNNNKKNSGKSVTLLAQGKNAVSPSLLELYNLFQKEEIVTIRILKYICKNSCSNFENICIWWEQNYMGLAI